MLILVVFQTKNKTKNKKKQDDKKQEKTRQALYRENKKAPIVQNNQSETSTDNSRNHRLLEQNQRESVIVLVNEAIQDAAKPQKVF